MPKDEPSPNILSNLGRSVGVEIIKISLIPASMLQKEAGSSVHSPTGQIKG